MTSSRPIAAESSGCGPLAAIHATFICGRAEIFDNPLRVKVSTALFEENVSGVIRRQRIVEEHFVGDDCHIAGRTHEIQFLSLSRLYERPSRIVWMYGQHGATTRTGAACALHCVCTE